MLKSSTLTAGQMEAAVCHLLLKYAIIFAYTDKSNTFFKSVNNSKTLRFCKTMKANRMCSLLSQSV